jgi:tocopherol O-methyltransferase
MAYYQAANCDYECFWFSRESLAMHFGYYDATVRSHDASLLKMNEVLAQAAQIKPSECVLDAGCGYGGSAIWLARKLGCRVTGVTLVPRQVERARWFAHQHQVADLVHFERMDFTQTIYPDASFDVVWALESVVHTDRKAAFVQEAYRLLRPGGRLVISEYFLRERPPLSLEERLMLSPWLEGWAMAGLLTPGEYGKLFAASGFGRMHQEDLTDHVRRSVTHLGKLALPTLPTANVLLALARSLQAFHLLSTVRVNGYQAGLYQSLALRRGLWRYMVLVAKKAEEERETHGAGELDQMGEG